MSVAKIRFASNLIVDRKRGKILGMENSRFLNQKARILWQFRNLKKKFKDFYEKPLECNMEGRQELPYKRTGCSSYLFKVKGP